MNNMTSCFNDCVNILKKYDEFKFSFFTTYGRTALYALLKVIDVRDKEVILPALTCVTTNVSAIYQAGGIPIFVDVDSYSFEMDINELKKKINNNTKAVISHHYYGYWTKNVDEIDLLCKEKKVMHIEDCTHNLGNYKEYGSDARIYSFSKSYPSMAGGCITTNNVNLYNGLKRCFPRQSIINEFVKNIKTREYYYSLMDKGGRAVKFRKRILKVLVLIVSKVFRTAFYKISGNFYTDKWNVEVSGLELDVIATRKQLCVFKHNFEKIGITKSNQKRKIFNLFMDKDIEIHPYCKGSQNPRYLLLSRRDAVKNNLTFLELWPAIQTYCNAQKTDNIYKISKEYVAIDLFYYTNVEILS